MAVQPGQEPKVEELETRIVKTKSPTKDSPSYNHATTSAKVDYTARERPLKLCIGIDTFSGTNVWITYGEKRSCNSTNLDML